MNHSCFSNKWKFYNRNWTLKNKLPYNPITETSVEYSHTLSNNEKVQTLTVSLEEVQKEIKTIYNQQIKKEFFL